MKLMVIGAHPDDCELTTGGTATLCRRAGWEVRFVSVTNGNSGHQNMKPGALAARRLREAKRAAGRIGASFETLGEPDGRLYVTEKTTAKVITVIRKFNPDVVICPRACDYHRDHRYSGQLVLDASVMLGVPLMCPRTPAREVPIILYAWDSFTESFPFRPDLLLDITDVLDVRERMFMDHESQVFEWLPWINGRTEVSIKHPFTNRREISEGLAEHPRQIAERFAKELAEKYKHKVDAAEAFQLSEYGKSASRDELEKLFPF